MVKTGIQGVPNHVAVIMDGNRRWADLRGEPYESGYDAGIDSAVRLAKSCADRGVSYLTLYGLSSENLSERSDTVLNIIFTALGNSLERILNSLNDMGARITFMGELEGLPAAVTKLSKKYVDATSSNSRINIKIAINYSGRQEILTATRRLINSGKPVDAVAFASMLYDSSLPDPDLLIRTGCSNRVRLSNFMLWQVAYAELLFVHKLWPDYSEEDFVLALDEFSRRKRLFGR